ncbi:hypothetical protein E4U17_006909 [Claviceps sp. LM77 group G4]|nr:hypothetical protein E4U17_006909 [Claviceps sp. LM77 group G4]KAG6080648.1 hypothetical protein E4U33_007447 [Claviceps sp. LM78 group G4]KAG6081071.1 hypothetical protein E4U16_007859 [Claviceps sp. LM84 group G4]
MELTYQDPSIGFQDHFDGSGTDLYSLNPAFSSMSESDPSIARVSSIAQPQLGSGLPASTPSSEGRPKSPLIQHPMQEKTTRKPKKQKSAPLKHEKPKANSSHTRGLSKSETRHSARTEDSKKSTRRERSLERNRVAASKCRKRKKAWTEKLEEKKSGLEAMNSELQSQYLGLLEESSYLKNHLISHAGCHDPNIDVWINNEASKYVRRLSGSDNPHRDRSIHSLPSLENNSVWHSSGNSHYTGLSESSPAMDGDDSNEEDAVDENFEDEFGEDMF